MLKNHLQNPSYLSDVLRRDGNNFDILRLAAAAAVIIGHAYAIAPQPPLEDLVGSLLHFEYSGSLAVKFFFFLSGLLVTESLIRRPEPIQFLVRRALRIFPGLLLCLLVAVFIVGPVFTRLPIADYFMQKETWSYLIKNFSLVDLQWRLPGVFSESKWGLNGSLWTLPYESMCYLYIAIFCGVGIFSARWIANLFCVIVIAAAFFAPQFLPRFAQNPDSFLLPACFLFGSIFAINKESIKINLSNVILLWIFVLLVNLPSAYQFLFYVAFFYTSIFVASRDFVVNRLKLPFDASYGIYVYGFMIQQCLYAQYPRLGVHGNQFLSLVVAFILGVVSWYSVEKAAISFGHKLTSTLWIKEKFSLARNVLLKMININTNYPQRNSLIFLFGVMELSVLFILAFGVHALVLKFVYPGYYHPFTPQHSDYYIPVELANSAVGVFSYIHWPRPVGMMFAYLIGFFGIYGATSIVVGLTILNCAISAALLRRILNLEFKWGLIGVFCVYAYLVFSESHFYNFYSQDGLSHLSYFFLMVGVWCFYINYKNSTTMANVLLFFFTTLAFLSKETYGLSAFIITGAWFLFSYKQSILRAIMPTLIVAAALILSLGYNLYVKSPFLSSPAYVVNLSPVSILSEWLRYARDGLNFDHVGFFLLIALAGYYYFHQKDKRPIFYVLIGCIVAAIFAWLPNSLLPEHHFSGYSWSGASILFLPVLMIPMIWKKEIFSRFVVVVLVGLCLINPIFNKKEYATNEWVLYQENTQRNLLKSLRSLIDSIEPAGEKILVTGLTFPFSPFDHPGSLTYFPKARFASFDVVRYSPIVNDKRVERVQSIVGKDLDLSQYSQIWVFNNDGSLLHVVKKGERAPISSLRIMM